MLFRSDEDDDDDDDDDNEGDNDDDRVLHAKDGKSEYNERDDGDDEDHDCLRSFCLVSMIYDLVIIRLKSYGRTRIELCILDSSKITSHVSDKPNHLWIGFFLKKYIKGRK